MASGFTSNVWRGTPYQPPAQALGLTIAKALQP
jgi:hypothetical protein